MGHSPSEVGMVTPSAGCVNGVFSGGIFSTGIIPGMIALVICWCVCGVKRICIGDVGVGAIGVDDV